MTDEQTNPATPGPDPAVRELLARTAAITEILSLLLAEYAERSPFPIETLREISNRLSAKLDADRSPDRQHLGDIERELDHIIATARAILE